MRGFSAIALFVGSICIGCGADEVSRKSDAKSAPKIDHRYAVDNKSDAARHADLSLPGDQQMPDAADEHAEQGNSEAYGHIDDNPFLAVAKNPLSTFSIDVDTASYANVRRFLRAGQRPPKDAVRIEELINYFSFEYPPPMGDQPFSVNLEVAQCPWNIENRLLRVGLKGKEIPTSQRRPGNLVFLIDVSGSMEPANKLPLVKRALGDLVEHLNERDRVAIVVYAGASGLALPLTSVDSRETILAALDRLHAGGSTAGSEGIRLAYEVAAANFIAGGVNRVILCTDGDFNVGITSHGELVRLIEQKAKTGVFLSVLGFGMGNLKDSTMELLADKGNGNYAYIDSLREAHKVLVEQMGSTLVTIAKDVKIQIEFNPARIAEHRLIGYENRLLQAKDFNDDEKDAGEIGAGHTVTALYELVPAGKSSASAVADPLKSQSPAAPAFAAKSGDLLTIKLRYKLPDQDRSWLIERTLREEPGGKQGMSPDLSFAAAVAQFGMLLRDSPHKGKSNYALVLELAQSGIGVDKGGHRKEFIEIARAAARLDAGNHVRD